MSWHLEQGDCREVLKQWAADGVLFDSCVTDPPYDLTSIVKRFGKENAAPAKAMKSGDKAFSRLSRGFMGQTWDGTGVAFDPETWRAVYDVLKPGAHLVAFGGTRTSHRMTCAIEDAGFEIRDNFCWLFSTGFPKSHNVSSGIAKKLNPEWKTGDDLPEDAKPWVGFGTSLKPAYENITLARKPIEGTVAGNTLSWGVGGINIDGCRVEGADKPVTWAKPRGGIWSTDSTADAELLTSEVGRWPANLLLDNSPEVLEAFAQFGEAPGQMARAKTDGSPKGNDIYSPMSHGTINPEPRNDSGTAARFFPCCPWSEDELRFFYSAKANKKDRAGSNHPTVKPISLMKWLTRLVTPPGGIILEPFAGSGSTIQAAVEQGFDCMAIEQSADYCVDIRNRMKAFANV